MLLLRASLALVLLNLCTEQNWVLLVLHLADYVAVGGSFSLLESWIF